MVDTIPSSGAWGGIATTLNSNFDELSAPPSPVTGYSPSSTTYTLDAQATTADDLDISGLTEGVTQTVRPTAGPTGTIWAALNDLPTGCTSITVVIKVDLATTGGDTRFRFFGASKGETISTSNAPLVFTRIVADSGPNTSLVDAWQVTIPLGADNSFDFVWDNTANGVFEVALNLIQFTV